MKRIGVYRALFLPKKVTRPDIGIRKAALSCLV